jgi:hypothetical protein
MVRRILTGLVALTIVVLSSGPVRAEEADQQKYGQATGYSTETEFGKIEGTSAAGCRTVSKGYAFRNGYGATMVLFVGNLRWCWSGGRVRSGSMWISVSRCCWWYYEGIVHQQNLGCFGGCTYVQKHRRGSFIFNPPWPTITTRVQPWFTITGYGNGAATASSGAGA